MAERVTDFEAAQKRLERRRDDRGPDFTPISEAVAEARTAIPDGKTAEDLWKAWLSKRISPAAIDLVLREYGIAQRFRSLDVNEALLPAAARTWVDLADQGAVMILAGPVGSGKTATAAWCLRELYLRRSHAGAEPPKAKILKTRDLYQSVFAKDEGELKRIKALDALVIDDWGSAYEHDWPLAELEGVIDRRWDEQRPTIVTTNLNPEPTPGIETGKTLRERLPRSFDRLTGDPGPGVVILDRASLRHQRAEP